eukprot:CAMPEP_0168580884 /NCGR_PEP_ID=MMETSP0420-20121227/1067_1 /TAXON_ID=498008 /ORGANISM="Pessonella sp." /LENGTH=120 /DNA_ID=CAMNT_0008615095 /DNA_START=151 /DNA_END=510 /DNA_ORIENTATION=-
MLMMCLNVGVKPPEALCLEREAKLEVWTDPLTAAKSPDEAADAVAKALEHQYETIIGRTAKRLRFKFLIDPTNEKVLRTAASLRDRAKPTHSILVHFNGHGVPSPSDNGEIWTFNQDFTQ